MAQTPISADERKALLTDLKNTEKGLMTAIKGLSTEQLNFKPTADAWSIAECVEHIAISETNIFGMVTMGM